jgi:cell division protein ZapA
MESSPSRVRVRILGEEYTIVGDADETTIRNLATMIDERMQELKQALPSASTSRLAVLCAINLADELNQLKLSISDQPSIPPAVLEKTKKIISLLEEGIIGDIYP